MADTSSPALAEKTIVDEIKANTPKCWRTLYHLLDLYSTMPETKTLGRKASASRLSVIDEEPEKVSQTQSHLHGTLPRAKPQSVSEAEKAETPPTSAPPPPPNRAAYTGNTFTQSKSQPTRPPTFSSHLYPYFEAESSNDV